MAQVFYYPPTASSSAEGTVGSPAPSIAIEVAGVDGSGDLRALSVDASGHLNVNISGGIANPLPVQDSAAEASLAALNARLPGGLVPAQFDQTSATYIVAGNGAGQIGTVVYKLSGSTVKTLTLTYDGSDRFIDVVAS